jgi:hypothetical protein
MTLFESDSRFGLRPRQAVAVGTALASGSGGAAALAAGTMATAPVGLLPLFFIFAKTGGILFGQRLRVARVPAGRLRRSPWLADRAAAPGCDSCRASHPRTYADGVVTAGPKSDNCRIHSREQRHCDVVFLANHSLGMCDSSEGFLRRRGRSGQMPRHPVQPSTFEVTVSCWCERGVEPHGLLPPAHKLVVCRFHGRHRFSGLPGTAPTIVDVNRRAALRAGASRAHHVATPSIEAPRHEIARVSRKVVSAAPQRGSGSVGARRGWRGRRHRPHS